MAEQTVTATCPRTGQEFTATIDDVREVAISAGVAWLWLACPCCQEWNAGSPQLWCYVRREDGSFVSGLAALEEATR